MLGRDTCNTGISAAGQLVTRPACTSIDSPTAALRARRCSCSSRRARGWVWPPTPAKRSPGRTSAAGWRAAGRRFGGWRYAIGGELTCGGAACHNRGVAGTRSSRGGGRMGGSFDYSPEDVDYGVGDPVFSRTAGVRLGCRLEVCRGVYPSGAISLFTAATIVSASDPDKGKQISPRSVRLSLGVAVWSLCLGLGAAIQTFSKLLM
jgi:hypothetical protein